MPEASPQVRQLISPAPGVRVALADSDREILVFADDWRGIPIPLTTSLLKEALQAVAQGGVDPHELVDVVWSRAGSEAAAVLRYYLLRLAQYGLLQEELWADEVCLAARNPPVLEKNHLDELSGPLQLSRFSVLRRLGQDLVMESPQSGFEVRIFSPLLLAVIGTLARPQQADELQNQLPDLGWLLPALRFLKQIGVVVSATESGDSDLALRQWETHDLWFQYRSRRRDRSRGYGASYRFKTEIAPLPALKPFSEERLIRLEKPGSMSALERPLGEVMETRRSKRETGSTPITCKQLSEFLYRSARARRLDKLEPYEVASRIYPGGGACYPLEIYPLVSSCPGVEAGLYHYEPLEHALSRLDAPLEILDELLVNAALGTAQPRRPRILFILAARFQRVSWKYESMALATILKDVGVLYQTFYLVATAMELNPCALGGGNPDLFARATGLDPLQESSVGEFVLN